MNPCNKEYKNMANTCNYEKGNILEYVIWVIGPRSMIRHHARRGAEGALAFPEFIDSEKRTEEEISITISPTRFKISTGPLY